MSITIMNAAATKQRASTTKERSVFVGNIPYDVTEEMLKDIFSGAGSVLNFRLVTDRETGKPKGYGFCEYADGATALSAMRNLNGYEINGRNLRVDFADGGDKSSKDTNTIPGAIDPTKLKARVQGYGPTTSINSGEQVINAMEAAISSFGPLKLYDMLIELKEHARQRPEVTKTILNANPALTHAIIMAFKSLNIVLPAVNSGAPPPILAAPFPPPVRSPVPTGGILGVAPPPQDTRPIPIPIPIPIPPPAIAMGPPETTPSVNTGTRWNNRPGAPPRPILNGPPPPQMVSGNSNPGGLLPPPGPPILPLPIPSQSANIQTPISQAPLIAQPPSVSRPVPRDPRQRARDPRLAKRPIANDTMANPPPMYGGPPDKRQRVDDYTEDSELNVIAALVADMTREKLDLLPPDEKNLVLSYMHQHGIQLPQ